MLTTSLLTVAVAAAGALAIAAPAPRVTPPPAAIMERDILHGAERRAVIDNGFKPRNKAESDCLTTTYVSVVLDVPQPTGSLRSWLMSAASDGDVATITAESQVNQYCENIDKPGGIGGITLPASLSTAYATWSSSVLSWQKSNHDEVHSLGERCGPAMEPMFDALVATDVPECKSAWSAMFEKATAAPGSGSSPTKNGGPRETGYVAAVAAAAGVAGAMAML